MKPCRRCGQSTGRAPQARYCAPCHRAVKRECSDRYAKSERGRERRRIAAQAPSHKLRDAAWYDANREHILELGRIARARRRAALRRPVRCATLFCENRFYRVRGQSHKQFCDECAAIHRGRSYARRRTREVAA